MFSLSLGKPYFPKQKFKILHWISASETEHFCITHKVNTHHLTGYKKLNLNKK